MAIRSGRVGVRHDQVDHYGRIKNVADGIYSNLSAGSLVSSASAESSNVNTPSSFTGKIDLTSIKGNTIKWNQLVPMDWVPTITFSDGLSVTNNSDGSYTLNGTATASRFPAISTEIKGIQGHKYLIQVLSSQNKAVILQDGSSVYVHDKTIYTAQNNHAFIIYFNANTYSNEKIVPMIIDLTQMFGAGNEPTSVAQFKSMFPLDYYEYDTGSLLSFKANILQNSLTGEEIYLPTLTYFPTGMKSVGTVYDELTPRKAITRIGAVDLGTLTWTYDASTPRFYTQGISSIIKKPLSNDNIANITNVYEAVSLIELYVPSNDKCIAVSNGGVVSVKDTSYSDLNSFITAMNGVYLYYELATPVELPTMSFE